MTKRLWATVPIGKETMVDSSNSSLNIIVDEVDTALEINVIGYETRVFQHKSLLVEELNRLLKLNSVNVVCKLGVIAKGNIKSAHIVFEHEDANVVTYSGTFSVAFLGDVLLTEDVVQAEVV